MQKDQMPPTGRRRTTALMIAAQLSRPTSWESVKRGYALSAFRRAARVLGIPLSVVALVEFLGSLSLETDWLERPIVWPSNDTLENALNLGRTQIKTLIRVALELGLIEMRDSPNGQRYGYRKAGRIVEAYGFDLSPLAARYAEFEAIVAADKERRQEMKRLKGQIGSMRNRILSLTDAGQEQDLPGDWTGFAVAARQLAAGRSEQTSPELLASTLGKLVELQEVVPVLLAPRITVETGPMEPADRPHHTTTKPSYFAKATVVSGGATPQVIEGNESGPKTLPIERKTEVRVKKGTREEARSSALRGFIVTPDFILRIAPAFRSWVHGLSPSWSELGEASWMIRSDLGISQHAWGQACVILGRMEAVTVLATIAARSSAGQVRSPGGLLRRMVELHQQGELRLDRTLFGLADATSSQSH